MKRKAVTILAAGMMFCSLALAACGGAGDAQQTAQTQESAAQKDGAESGDSADAQAADGTGADAVSDQEAADKAAALIDAIYVQKRTEETDEQCAQAKAAWDALTDAQKELVSGEFADPDYFGRDTGDASLDDPRNQDDIGENEILVVSFGTSFNDSRVSDIKGIEDAIAAANPDWSVRRAFTSQIIINHIQARDGEFIDNMDQALERAAANGVKNLVVQPTHLMHGAEYDELFDTLSADLDRFETVKIAEPLLGEVGGNAAEVNADKEAAALAVTEAAVAEAGYESLDEAEEDGTVFVFMGHGTSHAAKVSYSQMQTQMTELGFTNVLIGTVEGEPEETSCEAVIDAAAQEGYKKVVLRPLMVVAGDHANNDMAGEDADSWASMFEASGYFDSVETQIAGLGAIPAIQDIYVAHTAAAAPLVRGLSDAEGAYDGLAAGVYSAAFTTDSGMFKVNEVYDGRGTLTAGDGGMTIHITLGSKNIVNLYPGLAADAEKEGAALLAPTTDTVEYEDGATEEVYGFDVPVPALDTEFDLAILGTKGKWYDHKVSVSDPVLLSTTPEDAQKPPMAAAEGTQNDGDESSADSTQDRAAAVKDGVYSIELTFEGGSGKAHILSPAELTVSDGTMTAAVEWSSANYDYMVVDGEKYLPVNTEGNSMFEIPVAALDTELSVIGDTVAMSTPHEVEYTVTFHSDTMKEK